MLEATLNPLRNQLCCAGSDNLRDAAITPTAGCGADDVPRGLADPLSPAGALLFRLMLLYII